MKLNADSVRALLTPRMVLDHFGVRARGSSQLAVSQCPQCGSLGRASVSIHPANGGWRCHHCGAQGGIFALVAGYAGLDVRVDFHRALGLAAAIAGVPNGVPDEDYARLVADSKRRREEVSQREVELCARARARMPHLWAALDRRSVRGERYLREHGVDVEAAHALDLVRYHNVHDPALPLRDLASGQIVGIQYRCMTGDAKLLCEPRSQVVGSAFVGCLADLARRRVAVIVEGLADSVVARQVWPDAAIFGAPGAGQIEGIARAVAPEVARRGGILIVVPDMDEVGIRASALAVVAAQAAGLELTDAATLGDGRKVLVADLGDDLAGSPFKDLSDARARGRWQWRWSQEAA